MSKQLFDDNKLKSNGLTLPDRKKNGTQILDILFQQNSNACKMTAHHCE